MALLASLGEGLTRNDAAAETTDVAVRPKPKYVRGAGPDGTYNFQCKRHHSPQAVCHQGHRSRQPQAKLEPLATPRHLGQDLRKGQFGSQQKVSQDVCTPASSSCKTPGRSFPLERLFPTPPKDFDLNLTSPMSPVVPLSAAVLGTDVQRPVTQGTLTLAKLYDSERGRQISRGYMLDHEMEEFKKDKSEFAKYRFECAREAGRASRERAKQWRRQFHLKKLAKMPPTLGLHQMSTKGPFSPSDFAGSSDLPRFSLNGIVVDDVIKEEDCSPGGQFRERCSFASSGHGTPVSRAGSERSFLAPEGLMNRHPGNDAGNDPEQIVGSHSNSTLRRCDKSSANLHASSPRPVRAIRKLKSKLRGDGQSTGDTADRKEWQRLSDDQKDSIKNVFSRQIPQNGSGTLDQQQVINVLRDCGLKGRIVADQEQVRRIVLEHTVMFGEVNLMDFSCVVVPQVRRKLQELMRVHLRLKLEDLTNNEVNADTEFEEEQCKSWLQEILGNSLMGAEALTELRDCFCGALQEFHARNNPEGEDAHKDARRAVSAGGRSGMYDKSSDVWDMWDMKPRVMLAFEDLVAICANAQEHYEKLQYDYLFSITSKLPMHLIAKGGGGLETDILPLLASFRRFDTDQDGTLDPSEMNYVLQEFGFLSGKVEEDEVIQMIVHKAAWKNDEHLTFVQFLEVIYNIRELCKQRRCEETKAKFHRLDKNRNGILSVQEVSVLFNQMGLAPTCRHGQDEIRRLLQDCDHDKDGELDLVEFQHLVQLVSEKLRSITRFREIELGHSLKLTSQQIREFRDFFWQIDTDGSGHLDMEELRMLMHRMRQRIDGDDIRLLMSKIDDNHNGLVDFPEFLKLVHAIGQLEKSHLTGNEKGPMSELAKGLAQS